MIAPDWIYNAIYCPPLWWLAFGLAMRQVARRMGR